MQLEELSGEKLRFLIDHKGIKRGHILRLDSVSSLNRISGTVWPTGAPFRTELRYLINLVYTGEAEFEAHEINMSLYENREQVCKYFGIQYQGGLDEYQKRKLFPVVRPLESKGLYLSERVTQEPFNNSKRATHCWSCKRGLDNLTNRRCGDCGWLICKCGACQPYC